jgi:hypothetical protein
MLKHSKIIVYFWKRDHLKLIHGALQLSGSPTDHSILLHKLVGFTVPIRFFAIAYILSLFFFTCHRLIQK